MVVLCCELLLAALRLPRFVYEVRVAVRAAGAEQPCTPHAADCMSAEPVLGKVLCQYWVRVPRALSRQQALTQPLQQAEAVVGVMGVALLAAVLPQLVQQLWGVARNLTINEQTNRHRLAYLGQGAADQHGARQPCACLPAPLQRVVCPPAVAPHALDTGLAGNCVDFWCGAEPAAAGDGVGASGQEQV